LVLAVVQDGDLIDAQITSKTYRGRRTIKLDTGQFDIGGLPHISYVRPDKLTTVHKDICVGVTGYVNPAVLTKVAGEVCDILKKGSITA